jgi:glycosyltransferase involved in cell wall biosynthesis
VALRSAYRLPGLLTVGQVEIAAVARRLALDVVHDPVGVMPLLLTSAVRVVTIHDAIPYVFPQTSTRFDQLVYHRWLPTAVRAAGAVITDSQSAREDIVTYLSVSPERVTATPLAADRRFRLPDAAGVAPVLSRYGIARPYILYVGALESRKNLPRLLEAYSRLRRWSSQWRLVIVGARKWKTSPIFDTVQALGLEPHVTFTGFVEDEHLPALYAAADLFAFPSLYEGFGLPVLEAMACGAPVVTSNTSSLPEVAGDAAILVDPTNVEQIAEAMWLVLSQPALAAALREKGLARAAQFTWERTARETAAVYARAVESSG